jgi:ribonuclease HI
LKFGLPIHSYVRSSIWHGIKHFVPVVKENTRWLIGTGDDILFWLDTWLDKSLADSFNFPTAAYPLLTAKVSSFIFNYEWKLPASIAQQDASLASQIHLITIPKTPVADRLVWRSSTDGCLSAKQAFQHLYPPQQAASWANWIWHNFVPPSSSFIAWRCFHDKMPTDENLLARGCVVVSACALCLSSFETTPHLFLQCEFSRQLWLWLGSLLDIVFDCSSFTTIFDSLNSSWGAYLRDVATAAIIHVIHTVWLVRNGVRFSNTKFSVQAATSKVLNSITLSAKMIFSLSKTADNRILQQLHILPPAHKTAATILILWKTPVFAWIKANTDGSATHDSAACGGIFRDHTAKFCGGFAQKVPGTVIHAELMAMILAMELAYSKGWKNLWLESDSKTALLAFENNNMVPWDLRNRWLNCRSLDTNLRWSHIYREGNSCADKLANLGHSFVHLKWWDSLPLELRDDFLRDKLGIPCFRFD